MKEPVIAVLNGEEKTEKDLKYLHRAYLSVFTSEQGMAVKDDIKKFCQIGVPFGCGLSFNELQYRTALTDVFNMIDGLSSRD